MRSDTATLKMAAVREFCNSRCPTFKMAATQDLDPSVSTDSEGPGM